MEAVPHIRTPDQRLRVFVSSTLQELAPERVAAREAISRLHLAPVLFEMGARPHPPRDLYRAYVAQSDVFVGVYGQRYGWVAPAMKISGLEDEYVLSSGKPRLIYIKDAGEREPRMTELIDRILNDGAASFRSFKAPGELKELVEDDLAHLLTERFAQVVQHGAAERDDADVRRAAPPIERGALVGREKEMADLGALLANESVGLITLTGPGGSGKTRLVVHMAHVVAADFPDGVFYVPLASVLDPRAVTATIAASLEIPSSAETEMSARLHGFLRDKRALLILDNFEQVIDAAPEVARLLSTCAKIKILITSRQALRVRGESELPVPPLPVRVDGGVSPAAELFERRAREVRPDFALTPDNASIVAEICRRLDGLPLAIELAASRARVLSPQAMLARLDRTLSLLTGGAKDLPERQRTLRATLEWSHELLTEDERTLFRRLGAFSGGFSLEKVEETTADPDAIERLESLVDKSLLVRIDRGDGETRFTMLETLSEYAREHLAASGEEAAIRRAHANAFAAFCERWHAVLTGARRREAQAAIAGDTGNVRAALAFCVASPLPSDTALGIRIATALHVYWYFAAEVSQALDWLTALQAKGHVLDDATAASAEWGRGMAMMAQADLRAVQTLLACRERLRETGQHQHAGYAAALAGLGQVIVGEPAAGIASLNDAIAIFRGIDDDYGEALAHDFLAGGYARLGEFGTAMREAEEAVSRFAAIPAPWGVANTWTTMGAMAVKQGDADRARQLFADAVALLQEPGDQWGRASAMLCLASTVLRAGEFAEARALFEEALVEWRSVGSTLAITLCLGGIGACAVHEGRRDVAAKLLSVASGVTDPGAQKIVAGLEKSGVLLDELRAARLALGDAAIRSAGRVDIDDAIRLALSSS